MEETIKQIEPGLTKKIKRINWGIDLDTFQLANKGTRLGLREKWHFPSAAFVIFEPRNAKPLYNKQIVIDAFSTFHQIHEQSLLLVATGSANAAYLGQLKTQVRRLGLEDSVRFLEKLSQAEMAEIYNLADLTVSIPQSDGFPQSVYEALACGSRLLLGDLPQYEQFISDFPEVSVVKIGDVSSTEQAFSNTLQMGNDEAYRARARAYAETNADAAKESAKLLAVYNELAKQL
jgi:glycosyltransferase involved in cell wall biosynthesis